jgi:hypothetical protein
VVAVIVAISLVILLGMLALTFDLGRVVAVRRDMVNASDAAVLAAARTCALQRNYDSARAAAGELIDENTANLSPTTLTEFTAPECAVLNDELKYVTVGARTDVEYFFAPILGIDSGSVNSGAAAAWGPAIGVANPVPLRLLNGAVNACIEGRPVGYSGPECAFGFDNTDQNSQSASQWGILDFPEGWPTGPPNPMTCSSQPGGASQVIEYLTGAGDDFNPVLWALPDPVYVCAEGGLSATVINWIIDWLNDHVGTALIFPVMADPTAFPPVLSSGGEAYPIIGFVSLSVMGAWRGQQARLHCDFQSNNASLFCVQLRYDGIDVVEGIPGSGTPYNIQAIRLVE